VNPWLAIAAVMASLALIAAFFAWFHFHREHMIPLARRKRQQARRHDFYENLRHLKRRELNT
jgi:hypothetical protein